LDSFILCDFAVYLYSFDRFFGVDKVCLLGYSGKKKIKAGDLLIFGNQYFLALGDKIVFSEQYEHLETVKAELVYKQFFTKPTLNLFHWMVETYYTTYKSVVRLFITNDIEKLLERENKLPKIAKNWQKVAEYWFSLAAEGQTLIVFSDLWTMFNSTSEQFRESEGVVFLSATQTEKQKDVHRWEIKKWMKSVIICTYAEIFQDFYDLKKIIFVDPHKRYYANQQDPRYKVGEVIEEMKKLYNAEVEIMWV
jgi:primosomal protein N'